LISEEAMTTRMFVDSADKEKGGKDARDKLSFIGVKGTNSQHRNLKGARPPLLS